MTVLRHPSLGDVELGHDFDAGDDRVLRPLRYLENVLEHAVNSKAYLHEVRAGLDVDVARIAAERIDQNQVHHLHYGSALGLVHERAQVHVRGLGPHELQAFRLRDVAQQKTKGGVELVALLDGL